MRKLVALGGACLFFFLIFSMYLVLDQFSKDSEEDDLFKKVSILILNGPKFFMCCIHCVTMN